ncbi:MULTISPECIES: replication initiation factor [unclassified Acidovorax]|uniref:replication initiation factor n=1 Tax=unclassified Acidovorax TaxID=2684926 RepID=UPI000C547696|nr:MULTISPECIES: replication initiation factor [unclassified Acidovorax]PIF18171.1 hypothetical protein CLU87_2109 [Acidovorax sp. 59]PKW02803.1 hypothetical protein CLU89_2454 [Acidovorax sp. 30]
MSKRNSAGKATKRPQTQHPAASDSMGARGARTGESDAEGIAGAAPSNTAPDNSKFIYQPLRWGVDSLYLSYPGVLSPDRVSQLRHLKSIAQGPDHEAAKAQLQLGSHVFEVKDKSSGLFAFTLVDGSYMIRLGAGKSKQLPMAYVQVSSQLLSHKGPMEIESELRDLLRQLGEVHAPKVSRVDLYLDFACDLSMEGWSREAWVTRACAVNQYAEDKTFTGWTIGAGGALMARLYHKLLECKKSGKEYLLDLWARAGWDQEMPVWRLEFQFKREVLVQLDLDTLGSVMENRAGLWSYATTDWLRLCLPTEADNTRSRWPIHPLWMAVSSVDWGTQGGPLLRSYQALRAPSLAWLGARTLSAYASIGAITGITDFDAAALEAKKHAYDVLGKQNGGGLSGVGDEQFFREKVEALTRLYNTRMNPALPPAPEPYQRNEYERQSRG